MNHKEDYESPIKIKNKRLKHKLKVFDNLHMFGLNVFKRERKEKEREIWNFKDSGFLDSTFLIFQGSEGICSHLMP